MTDQNDPNNPQPTPPGSPEGYAAAPPSVPTPPTPPPAPPTPPAAPPAAAAPAAPQQPAPAYAPPAQVYAAPAAAAPAAPAEKRKGKKGIGLIVVIVVLLLCCGVGGCTALIGGLAFNDSSRKQEAIAAADKSYNAAVAKLTVVGSDLDKTQITNSKTIEAEITKAVAKATGQLSGASSDLAASQAKIDTLPDSEFKTAYVAGLTEAQGGLTELKNMLLYVKRIGRLLQIASNGTAKIKAGTTQLDQAISAANRGAYAVARNRAGTAATNFKDAENIFRAADKADPSVGFDTVANYAAKYRVMSSVLQVLAGYGERRNVSAYNKQVERFRAAQAEANKIQQPPIINDSNWADARLKKYEADTTARLKKADELMKKAQALKEKGSY